MVEAPIWEGPPPPRRAPMVISDNHAPFRSMADGRMYDSKSAYRRELKARGFEELGNDLPPHRDARDFEPRGVEADIKETIERLEGGETAPALPSAPPAGWVD